MAATLPTAAEVRDAYPEFTNASDALIGQKIAEAFSMVSYSSWGVRHFRGVLLLTAHYLALTPEGQKMRLKDGSSVYEKRFLELQKIVALGRCRVAGG